MNRPDKDGPGTALAVVSRERLVARAEPFIRRGLIVDGADCVEVYACIAKGEDDRIHVEPIPKTADPRAVAAAVALAILEEYDATEAANYRVDLTASGALAGSLALRIPRRKPATDDPVGDALLPRSVAKVEDAGIHVIRMALRHSEMATRLAVQSQEGRQDAMLKALSMAHAEIGTLRAQAAEDAARQRELLREENQTAAELLTAGARADAIREGTAALVKWGPRLAQRVLARDKLAPVVSVLRDLRPEQIETLKASGVLDAKQVAQVVDAWEQLNKDAAADEAAAAKPKPQPKANGRQAS